jgi:hypothetical protein
MKEFRVTLTQRAGELSRVTALLSEHGINLRSIAGIADGGHALVCFVPDDVAAMRTTLTEARVQFQEEELLTEIMENEAGAIADLAARLGDAGINLHSLYVLTRDEPLVEVGFTVDDPKKAKKVLSGHA